MNRSARASTYRQTARRAARWLDAVAVDQADGRAWPVYGHDETTAVVASLYGDAGVALFLSQAARVWDERWVREAARDAAHSAVRGSRDTRYWGLYTGLAGSALVVGRMARQMQDSTLLTEAHELLDRLIECAVSSGSGVEWPPHPDGKGPWTDLYHGNAGIGLALLALGDDLGRPDASELAIASGERLLDLAIAAPAGSWWRSRPTDTKPAPNIAHGTTGISVFLASLA